MHVQEDASLCSSTGNCLFLERLHGELALMDLFCNFLAMLDDFLTKPVPILKIQGCLGRLHKLCSTNSTVEQLHKTLEFVKYLFRCSHNSTLFSRTERVELKLFG